MPDLPTKRMRPKIAFHSLAKIHSEQMVRRIAAFDEKHVGRAPARRS